VLQRVVQILLEPAALLRALRNLVGVNLYTTGR
jgi:hypothetical protein